MAVEMQRDALPVTQTSVNAFLTMTTETNSFYTLIQDNPGESEPEKFMIRTRLLSPH